MGAASDRGAPPRRAHAASWHPLGTDANWGEVTRQLAGAFEAHENAQSMFGTEVENLERDAEGSWRIAFRDRELEANVRAIDADYMLNAAGGAALLLPQKSGIPQSRNYADFPVGGSFPLNEDPAVVQRHLACASGRAASGNPPTSVPHLDTRYVDGVRKLAFGLFSPNFRMNGNPTALFRSLNTSNLRPTIDVGIEDFNLVTYLAGQLIQGQAARIEALRTYYPNAAADGWTFAQAGRRVQIIRRTKNSDGRLQFGPELVVSADGSFASLLGVSPGASDAPSIVIDALERMFPDEFASKAWQTTLRDIVPSYGITVHRNPDALADAWAYTTELLELAPPEELRRATL